MRRRRVGRVAALGVALAAGLAVGTACASAPEEGDAEGELAGCYQFEWTADARELGLPWGFELLADDLEAWPGIEGGRQARTRATAGRTADHPFGFWRPLAGDSIRVGYPSGGGFSLTLAPEGDALRGTARPVGDAVPFGLEPETREPRPVVARKVVCPPAVGGGA